MSETYEAVQTISGRWEIRSHHDDCSEGIPLNESEIRRAVACLRSCAGIPTEALGAAGGLAKALDTFDGLARAADTAELLLRKTCPGEAYSLRLWVTGAIDALRSLGRLQ